MLLDRPLHIDLAEMSFSTMTPVPSCMACRGQPLADHDGAMASVHPSLGTSEIVVAKRMRKADKAKPETQTIFGRVVQGSIHGDRSGQARAATRKKRRCKRWMKEAEK
jgi:hypothetical protein